MGTCDNEHGDYPGDGAAVKPAIDQRPHQRRQGRGYHCCIKEERSCSVGEKLGRRLARFGLGDQLHDAGQRGVIAACGHLRSDCAGSAVDRSCDDRGVNGLLHRSGLAGDQRFIEVGFTVDDHSVRRHACAGANQHDLARRELGGRHLGDGAVGRFDICGVRHELCERAKGARRLAYCAHLHPMAEQHDVDQSDELPEEVIAEFHDKGEQGEAIGHRDRKCDQGHHGGLSLLDLERRHVEERETAVEEDGRGDDGDDEAGTGERWCVVIEPALHRLAPEQHRDTQGGDDPEALAEHVLVPGVVGAVFAVVTVTVIHLRVVHACHVRVVHRGVVHASHVGVVHGGVVHGGGSGTCGGIRESMVSM
ncbi:hypothetical protein BMS3Bbin02_02350 [bacterium BMS3Bbin02]|nr:hypothetical protein BMS3Bbin02_02350 [bacterium BMS3Bbin02]